MKEIAYAQRLRLAQDIPALGQAAVMASMEQFTAPPEVYNLRPAPPDHAMPIKAVVFNMERGAYLRESADFIRDCPDLQQADVILANELDDGMCRTGCRDTARELAGLLHMNYTYALEFVELVNPDDPKGYHGNAIFSRWPIRWAKTLYLPESYNWYNDRQKRIGGRVAIFALLDTGERPTGLICVHLENRTDGAGRAKQLQAVFEEAARLFDPDVPVILGGDMNTNTFDGNDPAQAEAMLSEQRAGAPARDIAASEPLLPLAESFGYDWRSFDTSSTTRRKPMPGGELYLQLDWIMTKGMNCAGRGHVSTLKEHCGFAREGSALAAFTGRQLSDHDAVWALCRRKADITTVLFDMGGTLEDVRPDEGGIWRMTDLLMSQLEALGHRVTQPREEFARLLGEGLKRYKAYSQGKLCELPVPEIWADFYLKDLGVSRDLIETYAEQFIGQWEVIYHTRSLRPGAKEMLETLRAAGYRLGVVSNNASFYSVFDMLKLYGIRHLFEEVTVSSVTGFRKPAPEIFRIAMLHMNVRPEECVYVGDTVSRDIIGPRLAGMAYTIRINSELTAMSDEVLTAPVSGADYEIGTLGEIPDILENLKKNR